MLKSLFFKILTLLYLLWTFFTLSIIAYSYYVINYEIQIYFNANEKLVIGLIINAILWCFISILFLFNTIIYFLSKKEINPFGNFAYFICFIFLLPFFMVISLLSDIYKLFKKTEATEIKNPPSTSVSLFKNPQIKKTLKILWLLISTILLTPLWYSGILLAKEYLPNYIKPAEYILKSQFNLVPDKISLTGTGSMYPTFPRGSGETSSDLNSQIVAKPEMFRYPPGFELLGKKFFSYDVGRGDIVSFSNSKTIKIQTELYGGTSSTNGFTKRVVAVPGDEIEIRDGLFYLNGNPQKEPYTARARSTFGGDFLPECQKIKIPKDSIFVMGDNRKGSSDSRHELGLISYTDIDHYIPFDNQIGTLDENWRDPVNDLLESSKIKLDKNEYLKMINAKRTASGAKTLSYDEKLEKSAFLRGQTMLKYNDFSFEAQKSGYTIEDSMKEAGYSNIVYGEWQTQGYYEEQELFDIQFEFPDLANFLLNPEYEEIGIAEVEGDLNGCPSQVIVYHLAGYRPPDYDLEVVNSWKNLLDNLEKIQPGWERLKDYEDFYKENKNDVDRINEIIDYRIENVGRVVKKMENNEWLDEKEQEFLDEDRKLSEEQSEISQKLNSN